MYKCKNKRKRFLGKSNVTWVHYRIVIMQIYVQCNLKQVDSSRVLVHRCIYSLRAQAEGTSWDTISLIKK